MACSSISIGDISTLRASPKMTEVSQEERKNNNYLKINWQIMATVNINGKFPFFPHLKLQYSTMIPSEFLVNNAVLSQDMHTSLVSQVLCLISFALSKPGALLLPRNALNSWIVSKGEIRIAQRKPPINADGAQPSPYTEVANLHLN